MKLQGGQWLAVLGTEGIVHALYAPERRWHRLDVVVCRCQPEVIVNSRGELRAVHRFGIDRARQAPTPSTA